MKTNSAPNCPLCGSPGEIRYGQLSDRSYHAPGFWDLRECWRADCGALWLDPIPIAQDLGLVYQGYYTHSQPQPGASWLRTAVWAVWHGYLRMRFGYTRGVGPAWQSVLSPLALLHPGGTNDLDAAAMYLERPNSIARVLDVGCGSGILLARMKAFGWETFGVEIDAEGVKAARARNLEVRHGQLAECNFAKNFFDAIHLSHVIEHVYDPVSLLRECHRVLKPGGQIVLLTPNTASWGHRRFGSAWLNLDPPRHLVLFNRRSLRSVTEQAGFQITRLDTSVHNAWVWGGLSRAIERTGRAEMSELGRFRCLAYGALFQLRERIKCWFDAEAGDEILLIAKKDDNQTG